jgi:hypothetical protein
LGAINRLRKTILNCGSRVPPCCKRILRSGVYNRTQAEMGVIQKMIPRFVHNEDGFQVTNEGEKRLIFFDNFLRQVRLSTDLIHNLDQRFPPLFRGFTCIRTSGSS